MRRGKMGVDPYHFAEIYLVTDCDEREFVDWAKKEFGDSDVRLTGKDASTVTIFGDRGSVKVLMWKARNEEVACERDIVEDAALIGHEAVHAAHSILDGAGLRLTDASEEAYAYLHQDISTQAMLFFWDIDGKKV